MTSVAPGEALAILAVHWFVRRFTHGLILRALLWVASTIVFIVWAPLALLAALERGSTQ